MDRFTALTETIETERRGDHNRPGVMQLLSQIKRMFQTCQSVGGSVMMEPFLTAARLFAIIL